MIPTEVMLVSCLCTATVEKTTGVCEVREGEATMAGGIGMLTRYDKVR